MKKDAKKLEVKKNIKKIEKVLTKQIVKSASKNLEKKIIVFTDGSSLGNPGPGGYGVVIVFPNGSTSPLGGVVELGGYEKNTTNNRMEITGPIRALEFIRASVPNLGLYTVLMHLDSQYTISGITTWIHGWKKNDWKTANKKPVLNQDLWQELHDIENNWKGKVEWKKVAGHAGVSLNERVDVIATTCASKKKCDLYSGARSEYKENITEF